MLDKCAPQPDMSSAHQPIRLALKVAESLWYLGNAVAYLLNSSSGLLISCRTCLKALHSGRVAVGIGHGVLALQEDCAL